MKTNIVRDYENHMLFISNMKQKLNHLTCQLERSDTLFSKYSLVQEEREMISKIVGLALVKLDKIVSPVKLTEIEAILSLLPTPKKRNIQ
ncbi:MAG TPA: hypothetical protein VL125_09815 [Pelobium sp.]|nr:hypothetical protein [Pelobium sp.]